MNDLNKAMQDSQRNITKQSEWFDRIGEGTPTEEDTAELIALRDEGEEILKRLNSFLI